MDTRQQYEQLFAIYKEKEKEYNDLHKKAKTIKIDFLLPMNEKLKQLERKMYKK